MEKSLDHILALAYFNGDETALHTPFDTLDSLFGFVQKGWEHYPALVIGKVITRRSQLPSWEKCPKDHVYVGIVRRKRGDKLIMVRHQIENILDCRVPAEHLIPKDLLWGVWPMRNNMHCTTCGEFATRIDSDGVCMDCFQKEKTGLVS